ncbi:MAG: 2-oxoglutarate dehydrogenase complex dihydrolipoyllysine-residue succinyltransferase [Hyphomonadaceae bacterium]|nr:2-oxoglutarate dehydrogenase complex dihydrolipoyllysine-residue succinyltransferase [Hyphomonadaceae bacterium]
MTDIVVPTLGESVTEATVAKWLKKPGDAVAKDETLVELETDKVSVEVSATEAGTLGEIVAAEGDTVGIGALLGRLGAAGAAKPAPAAKPAAPAPKAAQPAAQVAPPSVQRIAAESGIDVASMNGSGKDGRVTKGDALAALQSKPAASAPAAPAAPRRLDAREERVKMTRLRATIARRLKEAQNTAAMLTTFNEADMSPVMAVRSRYKDKFEEKHGVKLGFMSFFVKACVTALHEVPSVNAEIEGDDVIYKNFYDIGIAVGTDKGLVVPVLRDAHTKSMAQIEQDIAALGKKARDGQLKLEDLQGATFTISNGGVYGSLMSTPILNAPQSGILGMHKIQDRPVVVNGQIVIRPMMYLALSYDHRLVDGKEAVTFLVRVKENLEDPERMLLDL